MANWSRAVFRHHWSLNTLMNTVSWLRKLALTTCCSCSLSVLISQKRCSCCAA
ncbi:Uncharacterised protein [Vibrio cholerae]|nr:Uncharacterised protein [Vibrio cholerae]CSI81074.1 Uncharacterised protein [Vibrio cholerae]